MRIDVDDAIWVVTDVEEHDDLGDVCFETTVRGLELQFRGGMMVSQNPSIFTDREEAEAEGRRRLAAFAAARRSKAVVVEPGDHVEILDAAGEVLFTYTAPGGGE